MRRPLRVTPLTRSSSKRPIPRRFPVSDSPEVNAQSRAKPAPITAESVKRLDKLASDLEQASKEAGEIAQAVRDDLSKRYVPPDDSSLTPAASRQEAQEQQHRHAERGRSTVVATLTNLSRLLYVDPPHCFKLALLCLGDFVELAPVLEDLRPQHH